MILVQEDLCKHNAIKSLFSAIKLRNPIQIYRSAVTTFGACNQPDSCGPEGQTASGADPGENKISKKKKKKILKINIDLELRIFEYFL